MGNKLELKHLAPYLPYGLKLYHVECYEITIMNAIEDSLKSNGIQDVIDIEDLKPILRPLSDLTKEIEIFVEIFSLCYGINYTKNEIHNVFDSRIANKNYYLLTELNRQISISYDGDKQVFRTFDKSEKSIQMKTQLGLFNILFKNHFDVFGLIKKGLAIDINTI